MLEVFTVGGGDYLVNVFNAVAAWTGGGGYRSLLQVVMVMGLIYSLICVAFTLNMRAWLNWFLSATAIYLCLMVPTITVKVTDRINPGLAPATVANVPVGLAVLASFTSQVGDWLTRTAETVFVMPSELGYSSNGMIYGARLFDATRNFQIRDAEFATNLEAHFKNCLFGDVMLYQKSLTNLAAATDLWAAIGPGSEARSQEWLERRSDGGVASSIISCRQAYQSLDASWGRMIDANAPLWGQELFPKLSNTAAADKLRHDVPVVNQAFTGSGADFKGAVRQNTAINAFMQARSSMAGGAGAAAIDTFATTRADIQARNTYNSIAQQAMAWVPVLNIVLTVVFFAMFPVVFPLFLLPQTGVATLKGYIAGFFYLAAWGPLYVILHMICMSRAEAATRALAPGGASLGSFAGIGAANAETATVAGFMLMSVPFLAAGLARGAMGIAGQATSMLAPAQNAAEAAALEQTTGNYAFGNTSFANASANMRQSDQWLTAASYMSGAPSVGFRENNGAVISGFGNGQEVFDTSAAISRLGFMPTMTSGTVAEWREMATEAHRQAEAYERAASDILTATHTDRSGVVHSVERSSGFETSAGSQTGTSSERFDRRTTSIGQGLEERSSHGESVRHSEHRQHRAAVEDRIGGSVSAGLGGGGLSRGRAGRLPGIGATVSKSGVQQDQLASDVSRSRSSESQSSETQSARDDHANGTSLSASDGTYARAGNFSRSSSSNVASAASEDSLARARSYSATARRLEELSQSLSRDASYAESHNMQLSENMSQDLAQWYRQEQARNPSLDVPDLWATDLSAHQRAVRQEMISRWMDERRGAIRSEIEARLVEPSLGQVEGPAFEADGVRAAYKPAPLPAAAGGASGRERQPVGDLVGAGAAEAAGARDAMEAGRGNHVRAGADLRRNVERELGVGFFRDPSLRR